MMHFKCTFDVVRVWPGRRSEARGMSRRRESREARESKGTNVFITWRRYNLLSRSHRCDTQKLPRQQETARVFEVINFFWRIPLSMIILPLLAVGRCGRGSVPRPYLERTITRTTCEVSFARCNIRQRNSTGEDRRSAKAKGKTKGIATFTYYIFILHSTISIPDI